VEGSGHSRSSMVRDKRGLSVPRTSGDFHVQGLERLIVSGQSDLLALSCHAQCWQRCAGTHREFKCRNDW
jgi:hypothetical protein